MARHHRRDLQLHGRIFHAYYTVALAPAIAALVGMVPAALAERSSLLPSGVAGAAISLTAVLSFFLLGRTPDFVPWLAGSSCRRLAQRARVAGFSRLPQRLAAAVAAAAMLASLAGPAAYAVETATTPHTGSIPSAGPARGVVAEAGGGPRGCRRGDRPQRRRGSCNAGGGGTGGLLAGSDPPTEITALLRQDAEPTPGSPPRSAPTPRPATSWPPRSR